MFDSDIDSWYKWKRGDDINNTCTGINAYAMNGVRLTNSGPLNHSQSNNHLRETSSSNGLLRYDPISTSSKLGSEVRFINPAIYAETVNNDDEEQEVEIRVKVSSKKDGQIGNHGDFSQMSDMMTTLSINNDLATSFGDHSGDPNSAQETYRCYSLNSPTASYKSEVMRSKSVTSCRPTTRIERRCKIIDIGDKDDRMCARQINSGEERYVVNGHRVSTTSLSSIRISESRSNDGEYLKKITYSEWIRRKQETIRRKKEEEEQAEKRKQMEAEKLAREKEEKESRERENFLKWTEKKKREEEKKKAMVEKELNLQKQLKEFEDETAVVKSLHLLQWNRKKKEQERARRKKEEMKQKQLEEEKQRRLEESRKAYENWRKMAKNKPKPATQGLLPHQKAKPAYVNPTPWQRIVEDTEESEENGSNYRKTQGQSKINPRRQPLSYD
ncbi:uncharacterized protein LOC100882665 [Megachile rotundata]|uniref:uncharacterized protein LOC100882665 n=1 Tax=Megachile rotundata TaxID=143995 RepID=UPI000258E260|nr:PREDICTED: inner centromere protein-like [Megachile rotundata]